MTRSVRLVALGLLLSVVAVACRSNGATDATRGGPTTRLARILPSAHEDVPSGLDNPTAEGLPKPTIDPSALRPGGPGPDGIPAVDAPRFQRADHVSWLNDREPVLSLELKGQTRAYPVQILLWHEIVNDTVVGIPVAVSYCPLCNSALAFDRRLGGRVLDFGVSGLLYNSDLVMFDRQTRSLWPQLAGRAAAGVLTGKELAAFPVQTVSWGEWRRAHPHDWVLSRDTGNRRSYGTNPYPGYDDTQSRPFLFDGKVDGRLTAKTRVVGIATDTSAVAIPHDVLRRRRVIEPRISGTQLVVWFQRGTTSALDTASVAAGRDVGATGVFDPTVDGRRLHFDPIAGGFRDRETRTIWNVLGNAVQGPLAGRSLAAVAHVDSFWFAWAAFRPATMVIDD